MIQVTQLGIRRGNKSIIHGISFEVQPGKITAILGPNGAGKTTLLEGLTGRLPAAAGQIVWDGQPLREISASEQAGRRAVLSQKLQLNFPMEVFDLVEMGTYPQYRQLKTSERRRLVNRTLEQLDLQDFRKRSFQQLSGGEQQRVLLAKCMAQLASSSSRYDHQYLFLDEPTNNLDIEQQYRLMAQVKKLAAAQGLGIVAIVHDLNLAAQFADHLLLLKNGTVLTQGAPNEVLTTEVIKNAFNVHSIIRRHPVLDRPLITVIPHEIHHRSENAGCSPEGRTTTLAPTRPGQSPVRQ